jgi:guanylate kinase
MSTLGYYPFIISAPSGAGKTTLFHELKRHLDIQKVVSYTSRPPRDGEKNGVDYHFVTQAEFEEKIKANFFIEWATVFGHFYGTPAKPEAVLSSFLVYEVDVQGFYALKASFKKITSIFILPPCLSTLKDRLKKRQPHMSSDELLLRTHGVQKEIESAKDYDFIVKNKDLISATEDLKFIFKCERIRTIYQENALKEFCYKVK